MKTTKEEQYAANVLSEFFGLKVDKIPEGDSPSPDFLIHDGEYYYFAELKSKFESLDVIRKRNISISNLVNKKSPILFETLSTNAANNINNLVGNAAKQIKSYSGLWNYKHDFSIVILLCQGVSEQQFFMQFINSLYGRVKIYGRKNDTISPVFDCYYYGESAFYKNRGVIDGAIIISEGAATLCVNDLSPRYSEFKITPLISRFEGGVIDAYVKESQGHLSVRCDIDRKNKKALKGFLMEKYGFDYIEELPMPLFRTISKLTDIDG